MNKLEVFENGVLVDIVPYSPQELAEKRAAQKERRARKEFGSVEEELDFLELNGFQLWRQRRAEIRDRIKNERD